MANTSFTSPNTLAPWLKFYYLSVLEKSGTQAFDHVYAHEVAAPFGVVPNQSFYHYYHDWWPWPTDPIQAYMDPEFLYADMVGVNEFDHSNNSELNSVIVFSWFKFDQATRNDDEKIENIREVSEIIEESPLQHSAFAYSTSFVYFQVFLELESAMLLAFAVDFAGIWAVTFWLVGSPGVALCSTIACAMIVLEVYSVCMSMDMPFNFFAAAGLLVSAGLSVEFTTHTVAAYGSCTGTTAEKLAHAFKLAMIPILHGAASTFCGILPLILHPLGFVTKYFFTLFFVLLLIGMVNAFVVLPAALASIPCTANITVSDGGIRCNTTMQCCVHGTSDDAEGVNETDLEGPVEVNTILDPPNLLTSTEVHDKSEQEVTV